MIRRVTRTPTRRGPRRSTTRPQGTRTSGVDRGLLLVLGVVVLTVLALLGAGTVPRATGEHGPTSRTATLGRDLSCAGGLPGAVARVGHVGPASGGTTVDGRPATRRAFALGRQPSRVHVSARQAARGYAVRSASSARWLAAGACPSPRPDWWFVGVGGSTSHDSVLTLDNPRPGAAIVDVDVLGPDGPVRSPGLHGLRIDSGHAVRLDLKKVAPSVGDLAVHVSASRGLVTASAAEVWSASVIEKPANDWVTDQPGASRSATLVGLAASPRRATVLIANPAQKEAIVQLALVGRNGTFAPARDASVRVPPSTVLPVDLGAVARSRPMAVRLSSQVPVAATVRTTRGLDEAYAGSAPPIGAGAVVGLPVGEPAQLVLVGDAATGKGAAAPVTAKVVVTGYDAAGGSVGSRRVNVPPRGAATIPVWAHAVALRVTTDQGRVTGNVLLGKPGGNTLAVIPLSPTSADTHVPTVRPGW
ncbi:DUF5719 family protein [Nocardioides terrisoli]|uniref:DUF5719 family protein n=1 Tax=Nocardioides terrisoli TaxID=3388267 RepID=UPI00287BBD84|nr:DUF5719 family protein [Nocardioides marmorisolisilvae]